MKLPETTEWVLHCATALAQLPDGQTVSTGQLAEHFGIAAPYLAKQLAQLVRHGVLTATTGPRGGFRLARAPGDISILEVVEAVDGGTDPYICREIRQQGRGASTPDACTEPCQLVIIMGRAHEAWRESLRATTLADVVESLPPEVPFNTRRLLIRPG
ncbi:RrF2 family transcriptional regulator [Desertimonas flava]|jgi:Rrf2 family protein|uniref:RrF2 family transcriptional regulator n=1 Tax=Desertimonas flava TaxID=2064846 RepID=UPI000E34E515|nr:Rrf2 family transcriptional regulator [Desertimonas flava]